ncbi:hypothetical protein [Falsiroseomonas sp.]|uniref:hypothetical protein n=1 Tax=Falsiroseomonas sp. TaxID=2870721 RepID=UPI0035647A32
MPLRELTIIAAVTAALGAGGAALAQTAQQVNPSPMPPGSRANEAPGMGGVGPGGQDAGARAQQVNPTNMAPGTPAGAAPGMNPGGPAIVQNPREGVATGLGVPGGVGIRAPDAQPDVVPGTLRPGSPVPPPAGQAAVPPPPPATGGVTGATGGVPATTGGGTGMTLERERARATTEGGALVVEGGLLEEGANSFTAGQAAERMAEAGFNDVQDLRLDARGIWRGRAIRNGQPTGVGLDYRGNVAAIR